MDKIFEDEEIKTIADFIKRDDPNGSLLDKSKTLVEETKQLVLNQKPKNDDKNNLNNSNDILK